MPDSSSAVIDAPVQQEAAAPRTTPRRTPPKPQPPYAVIVENDDDHTMEYVVEVLQRVCGHPLEQAVQLTLQVHYTGQAAVWTGMMEVAELKRDQIRSVGPDFYARKPVKYPLRCRIEPMPQ